MNPGPPGGLLPPPGAWWTAARPKTLWAGIAPVLVGWAMAAADGAFHAPAATLALLGAILIQVGTNFHNDVADFEKGTDRPDRRGPVRVTASGRATPAQMHRATALVFLAAVAAGVYLMVRGGWPIVIVGFSSILFGYLYTAGRRSLAYLGVADLFVLFFFGPVAVGGTYWVQALTLPPEVAVAGLGPGALSVAILLVNNIRDLDEDREGGKRTLVVRLGRTAGIGLYAACIAAAASVPVYLWATAGAHPLAVTAAVVLVPGMAMARAMARSDDPAFMNVLLGRTARLGLLWSLLFSLGWMA